jgi:hypothetical protein
MFKISWIYTISQQQKNKTPQNSNFIVGKMTNFVDKKN